MAARSLPRGTLVEKIDSAPGDSHQDGARARVLSAFGDGYFVEWEDVPGVPVFILAARIRPVKKR